MSVILRPQPRTENPVDVRDWRFQVYRLLTQPNAIPSTVIEESVQDIVGGMVSGNVEDGITVTYDDVNGKLNFSVVTGDEFDFITIREGGGIGISRTDERLEFHASLGSILVRDADLQIYQTLKVNTINEWTSDAGVIIEGVTLKDSNLELVDNAWLGHGVITNARMYLDEPNNAFAITGRLSIGLGTDWSTAGHLRVNDSILIVSDTPTLSFQGSTGAASVKYRDTNSTLHIQTTGNGGLIFDDKNNIGQNVGGTTNPFAGDGEGVFVQVLALATPTVLNIANTYGLFGHDNAPGNTCPYFITENGTIIGLNQSLLTDDVVNHKALYLAGDSYTADLCTGGTDIFSSEHPSAPASYAFDDIDNTRWLTNFSTTGWIGYNFGSAKTIARYTIYCGSPMSTTNVRKPVDWTFQASATGAWGGEEVTLDTQIGTSWAAGNEKKTFSFANSTAYQYYRINITLNGGDGNFVGCNEVQMMEIEEGGLFLADVDGSHHLHILPGSDLSADRTLTLTTGDADRTITLVGDPTLGDWFDQDVKTTASPTHVDLTLTAFDADETIAQILTDTINQGILDSGGVSDDGGLNISWTGVEIYTPAGNIVEIDDGNDTCDDSATNWLIWRAGIELQLIQTHPLSSDVAIAHISCEDGVIWELHDEPLYSTRMSDIQHGLEEFFPVAISPLRGGLAVTNDPDIASDLDVTLSAGEYYHDLHEEHIVPQINSRTTPMVRWWEDGTWQNDPDANINTAQMNSGSGLINIPNNQWVLTAFKCSETQIHWIYADTDYPNKAQALSAVMEGTLPSSPPGLDLFPWTSYLIYKQGDTDLTTNAEFGILLQDRPTGVSGALPSNNHATLTNLAWSVAGHTFDAAVDFNTQNITNVGTLASGVITQSGTTLDNTYEELGAVSIHAALTTGTHGVGVSTIASVLDIATHTALPDAHHVAFVQGDADLLYLLNSLADAAGDIIYASADNTWTRLGVGANGEVLTLAAGLPAWVAGGGGVAAHNILDGSVHLDSVADAVTRGSLIYGNATPKWDELVISTGFLGGDGTDASWRSYANTLDDLSGHAGGAFDWNNANLTSVGTIACGAIGSGTITSTGAGTFQTGPLSVGVDKTTAGLLNLYGASAGGSNPQGGEVNLYSSSTFEGDVDHWTIQAYNDDLEFKADGNHIMTMDGTAFGLNFHTRAFTDVGDIGCDTITIATTKALAFTDGGSADIIRDEDDMGSDDANALVTQQSIKAYHDAHGFVDRGDPSAFDWDEDDLTTDNTWNDLDDAKALNLSDIVPVGAKAVLLLLDLTDPDVNLRMQFRKAGNSNTHNVAGQRTQVSSQRIVSNLVVPCDPITRKIEYRGANTTFSEISILVSGWWF